MMKPVNRIFLILGAMSMFSLFQFDARGLTAYDGSANCTVGVSAGLYCKKKNSKPSCPAGCYCDPGKKDAIGEKHSGGTIALVPWCRDHTKYLEKYLSDRGVHYCPDEFPKSPIGASSKKMCHNESGLYYDTRPGVDCPNEQPEGKFCKNIDFLIPISQDCRPGCYCTGGTKKTVGFRNVEKACSNRSGDTDLWVQLNDGHVYLCPEDFPYSAAGAKTAAECYKLCENNEQLYNKMVYCVVGKYLPKLSTECKDCPDGYRCPGNKSAGRILLPRFPSCEEDQGLVACPSGQGPNDDHTECISSSDQGQGGGDQGGGTSGGGNNGGGTQGGVSHSCQPGQYWKSGFVDIMAEARAVPIAVLRDTAQANTTRSAKKAATKSVVSRTAMQPLPVSTFNVSMAKTLDAADLRTALGGSCTDCEAGYYCPGGTQGRVACPEGKYTNTTGQTQCLVCNGTVTQTGNLNTGCSTDPDNPGNNYNVTYNCGDHGTGDLSNNGASHTSGTQVTTLASTACARNEGYTFSNWECMAGSIELSVNNAGQFTMPDADVTCTAQWSTGSNGNENEDAVCPVGQYLPADGEDADDCEQCSGNYVCPGDDASYRCPWTVSGNTCGGILDAGQLKKGKSRNRDCWRFFNSPSDYRECVYGFSID